MNDFIQIIQKEVKTSTDFSEIEVFIKKFIATYYQTNELTEQLAKESEYVYIKENEQFHLQEGFYFIVDGEYQVQKKFLKLPNFLVIPSHEKSTLLATSDVNLLMVTINFHEYVTQLKQCRTDQIVEFLQKTLFPNFPKNSVAKLSKHFCLTTIPFNHVIYKEKEESKNVYFIRQGEVRLLRDNKQLKLLTDNQIFGEYEVFFNKSRVNKAVSYSQVSLLTIKGEIFMGLLREYPILKQHLICQSVIKYQLMLQSPKASDFDVQKYSQGENELLIRQKKALRSLSPKQDCKQIFKMSQQMEKERVRTGYKVSPPNYRINLSTQIKCITMVSPSNTVFFCINSKRRKLELSGLELKFRSVSPTNSQRVSKVISSKHSMFRQQPTREILLHNFVNSFRQSY